jgi:hypothetical protein
VCFSKQTEVHHKLHSCDHVHGVFYIFRDNCEIRSLILFIPKMHQVEDDCLWHFPVTNEGDLTGRGYDIP